MFGRAVVFANSTGIYTIYGGAAEKVSGPLDGLFANATFTTGAMGGITPVSAVCSLYSIRCYLFAFTTINPFTSLQQTLTIGWDGAKWFPTTQLNVMNLISYSENNSVLSAYGATATSIYPMFTTPSTALDNQRVFHTPRSRPLTIRPVGHAARRGCGPVTGRRGPWAGGCGRGEWVQPSFCSRRSTSARSSAGSLSPKMA